MRWQVPIAEARWGVFGLSGKRKRLLLAFGPGGANVSTTRSVCGDGTRAN